MSNGARLPGHTVYLESYQVRCRSRRHFHYCYMEANYTENVELLGDPEATANIYCKTRNLPNKDTQNYSTELRYLLGHPVDNIFFQCNCRLICVITCSFLYKYNTSWFLGIKHPQYLNFYFELIFQYIQY